MKNCAVYYYIAAHMRGCCPALHVSRVDRAAQPGAMGAPSYVQPDHWDQAAHQLFYRSQAPADQLLFAKKRTFCLSVQHHILDFTACA